MLLTVPRGCFFCGSFLLFMFRVCHVFLSVHCCLVATRWERADFPMWVMCGTRLYQFLIPTFSYFVTSYYGLDSLRPPCELNMFVRHQKKNLERTFGTSKCI